MKKNKIVFCFKNSKFLIRVKRFLVEIWVVVEVAEENKN
ncbi:hypothetical protein OIU77_028323 [Salix suchowensis]|uniref:Ribosomal protein L32 n=1 Tax=Salix suchowensis TaxID=1278906 RepID=A0ABQ9BH54_9ROSI|nr:hypothetical protein OIU77_028323 [Salix suchowensis]